MTEVAATRRIRDFSLPETLRRMRESRVSEQQIAEENPHLRRAMRLEKHVGQRIAVRARTVAILISAVVIAIVNPRPEVLYYHAFMALFIALGWLQLRFARVGQSRAELALIQLDLVLLAVVLLVPNPFLSEDWPTAVQFRFEGFVFYFLFLSAATLAYSWRTVIAMGTWTALVWTAGAILIAYFGRTVPELSSNVAAALDGREVLFEFLDPNSINVGARLQEIVIFVLVAGILGLKSWRSNQLLLRQAQIAAERANLSRYFPPTLVEDLASRDQPLAEVRSQPVAVLFADVVGFTRFAETRKPEEVVETLRQLHAMLERIVFGHGGTLDKYLGDGVMATFGTPRTAADDAARALAAALAIRDEATEWNAARTKRGEEPLQLSVGLHYGPVVLGDIGTERRLEFATLGDTVNVAARLEAMTREVDAHLLVSDGLVAAIADKALRRKLTSGLKPVREATLRGRGEKLDLWAG